MTLVRVYNSIYHADIHNTFNMYLLHIACFSVAWVCSGRKDQPFSVPLSLSLDVQTKPNHTQQITSVLLLPQFNSGSIGHHRPSLPGISLHHLPRIYLSFAPNFKRPHASSARLKTTPLSASAGMDADKNTDTQTSAAYLDELDTTEAGSRCDSSIVVKCPRHKDRLVIWCLDREMG